MATVDLTLGQIVDAVRQLPKSQRQFLLEEIAKIPSAEEAHATARRVRGTYRMDARKRKRMSKLLLKGNSGTLTDSESEELDRLVDEFESKALQMARAIAAEEPRVSGGLHPPR
jgi:hypothetical protein